MKICNGCIMLKHTQYDDGFFLFLVTHLKFWSKFMWERQGFYFFQFTHTPWPYICNFDPRKCFNRQILIVSKIKGEIRPFVFVLFFLVKLFLNIYSSIHFFVLKTVFSDKYFLSIDKMK